MPAHRRAAILDRAARELAGRVDEFATVISAEAAKPIKTARVEAARAVGATPAQQASWAAALCLGMAVTSFYLSWRYRMPIITAWSTPGARRAPCAHRLQAAGR